MVTNIYEWVWHFINDLIFTSFTGQFLNVGDRVRHFIKELTNDKIAVRTEPSTGINMFFTKTLHKITFQIKYMSMISRFSMSSNHENICKSWIDHQRCMIVSFINTNDTVMWNITRKLTKVLKPLQIKVGFCLIKDRVFSFLWTCESVMQPAVHVRIMAWFVTYLWRILVVIWAKPYLSWLLCEINVSIHFHNCVNIWQNNWYACAYPLSTQKFICIVTSA